MTAANLNEDAARRAPTCDKDLLRIGVVARMAGVSERTVRYYEEVGLVSPAKYSAGGTRLFKESDVVRVLRIKELKSLMGFDLDEIKAILTAEDRLGAMKEQYREGDESLKREIHQEAQVTIAELRAQVAAKLQRLQAFLEELDSRSEHHAEILRRLNASAHEIPS